MNDMQPSEVTALSDELRAFTERAWQQLQDEQDAILTSWPKASADARRKRLAGLQQTAARLTAQVDELALALATTGLHTAYTLGAAAGGSAQFTAADIDALGVLAQDLYDAVLAATRGVNNSTKLLIRTLAREHVGDRLLGGKTATDAARDLRKELQGKGITSVTYRDGSRQGLAGYTDMLARTQTALAYNHGALNAAGRTGVGFMEVFDGFGCGWIGHDDSDKANGTIRTIEECTTAVISHPRCVPEGSLVGPLGGVIAGYRAWYDGPMIEIGTAGGARVTVTPNHPVLTSRGWIPAICVDETDQVLRRTGHGQMPLVSGLRDGDFDDVPARIEEIFETVRSVGTSSVCVPTADDFHGDGSYFKGDVDVVRPGRELPQIRHSKPVESLAEAVLMRAGACLPGVPGAGPLLATPLRLRDTRSRSRRFPRGRHVPGVGILVPDGDPLLAKPLPNNAVADAHLAREVLRRFAIKVTTDQVVEVGYLHSWSGHVYDLTTTGASYVSQDIILHNCQRAFGPRPDVATTEDAQAATRSQTASQAEDQRQVAIVRQARVEARARRLAARRQKIDARSSV